MKSLIVSGRIFFAIAIAGFGIHFLTYASGAAAPPPGPPWIPGRPLWAYLWGAGLVLASLSITTKKKANCAGIALGIALFLLAVLAYFPRLAANIHNPAPWTSGFELLAICGGALVFTGLSQSSDFHFPGSSPNLTTTLGLYLFAIPLMVFGTQHFLYARFIATLIPAWIPGHLFWAYFVGVAFFATALAIIFRTGAVLATSLLGLMFLLWVILLHLPRVATSPHNGNEWTSAFVALAMSGSALALAGTFATKLEK
jgi:hypothetical protein